MWRVVEFLGKYGYLLLFLFLQTISFIIIIRVNSPQMETSQAFFLQASGKVNELYSNVSGYFGLGAENERLANENTELKNKILSLTNELIAIQSMDSVHTTFALNLDSITPSMGHYFMPCKAINNSTSFNYNYITLNKGSRHGVKKGMGLVSPQGVAGRVIEVSTDYSLALSLVNLKFKLSSKLLRSQNVGTLSWDGTDPSLANLNYIPQTSGMQIGDTVVTSGYGTSFPENFIIGKVSYFDSRDQNGFYYIQVELSSDFRSLSNLYLVGHRDAPQLDSLESKATGEK
jgi:rod shape-determining protein MreC